MPAMIRCLDHWATAAHGNGRATLRMYHFQFPDRRMPHHRIFQWLHRQPRVTRSFQVTRYDAGRRRDVRSPSLEVSIVNVVADRPEFTRVVAHHVSVSHQTICRVLNENRYTFSIFSAYKL
ncbi:uncharacterized protein TNCV_3351611 [Trichonephila clavipes]|nr:uncharacterized protein TNCV_3351611 [Trichonephila clavipes]